MAARKTVLELVGRVNLINHKRSFVLSNCLEKNRSTAIKKVTPNRTQALTYEEAQKPCNIGVRKSWNSWNSSNLEGESEFRAQTTWEDIFIRKFMLGTWVNLFVSEIIIKRRHNVVVIAGIVNQSVLARKMYFLKGYTEEMLSLFLKRPVKLEIQTVADRQDFVFKYI